MTDPAVAYLPGRGYGTYRRGTELDVWPKAANRSPSLGVVWPGMSSSFFKTKRQPLSLKSGIVVQVRISEKKKVIRSVIPLSRLVPPRNRTVSAIFTLGQFRRQNLGIFKILDGTNSRGFTTLKQGLALTALGSNPQTCVAESPRHA